MRKPGNQCSTSAGIRSAFSAFEFVKSLSIGVHPWFSATDSQGSSLLATLGCETLRRNPFGIPVFVHSGQRGSISRRGAGFHPLVHEQGEDYLPAPIWRVVPNSKV